MHRGYIKLWRKVKESRHASDGMSLFGLSCWIMVSVNHKPAWFMGDQINPGSFATSYQSLAEQCKESIMTIRRLVEKLVKYEVITKKIIRNKYTLITLCNWEDYQNEQQAIDTQTTSDRLTINKRSTDHQQQSKNEKNEKNEKNNKGEVFSPPEHLKDLWAAYLDVRKSKKAVRSNNALQLIVKKLETLAPGDHAKQHAILERSVIGNWIGVFQINDREYVKYSSISKTEEKEKLPDISIIKSKIIKLWPDGTDYEYYPADDDVKGWEEMYKTMFHNPDKSHDEIVAEIRGRLECL